MIEPFPSVPGAEPSAATNLRRTGFNARAVVADDTVIIHLQGELDLATAGHLRRVVDASMADDATGLVLDLTDLTFVDSTGITTFLRAGRQAENHGRSFTLRHPSRAVLKPFASRASTGS